MEVEARFFDRPPCLFWFRFAAPGDANYLAVTDLSEDDIKCVELSTQPSVDIAAQVGFEVARSDSVLSGRSFGLVLGLLGRR